MMSWSRTGERSFPRLSSRSSPGRSNISPSKSETPRVVVIFGPTAVGKSETLEAIANGRFEVINADSMQAYRHMDVGTAKPSRELLSRVAHHLISFLEPSEQYNVGIFVKRAESLIAEIIGRGKAPVVCGGTAFYIRSLLCGLPESPQGSAEARERLRRREKEEGGRALYGELQRLDPEAAARIQPGDRYRIMRALEILESSGRSQFSFRWPREIRGDYNFLVIGLDRPREELYARIEARVEQMFRSGLVEEVKRLLQMGFGPGDPGMQAIGYREFFPMRKGCATIADVKEEIKADSRRFAKRQLTFFRPIPGVRWMSPEKSGVIVELIHEFVEGEGS